jgi:hypothetical protein
VLRPAAGRQHEHDREEGQPAHARQSSSRERRRIVRAVDDTQRWRPYGGDMSDSLSTTWLGARLGRDPQAIDAARRAGQLLGIRVNGHYAFPSWQFGADGNVLPSLPRVIAAARAVGISDDRLGRLLDTRAGLAGGRRLADALRDGNVEHVLNVVRATPA